MADSHKAFRADGFQLSVLASAVSELRTVLIGFHTTMMQQPKPKIIPQWSQCLNSAVKEKMPHFMQTGSTLRCVPTLACSGTSHAGEISVSLRHGVCCVADPRQAEEPAMKKPIDPY